MPVTLSWSSETTTNKRSLNSIQLTAMLWNECDDVSAKHLHLVDVVSPQLQSWLDGTNPAGTCENWVEALEEHRNIQNNILDTQQAIQHVQAIKIKHPDPCVGRAADKYIELQLGIISVYKECSELCAKWGKYG